MGRCLLTLLGFLVAATVAHGAGAYDPHRLVIGLALEPPHLDPTAGAAAAIDEVVYANVFEGLVRIDENGAVLPSLARSWDIADDGLTYTFHLRDGVTFHDGTTFDSADAKFSLDRARAPDSTNAQKNFFAAIADVTAPNALTVRLALRRPDGLLLFNLGSGDAVMVAPETAATNLSNPVGTGPFRFERWTTGESVAITRVHPGDGINQVVFKIIPDPAAQVASLLAEDVDAFPNFSAPESLAAFAGDARFTIVPGTTEGETILAINNARPPLDDVRVRRAIAHAIDRQAILDGAMSGIGTPIGSHFAPHHAAYVDLTGLYPHDPARAKALLAEAGLGDGFAVTLKLPPPAYARRGGEIVAAQLAAVGISATIEPVEWAQWLEMVFTNRDYDLTIVSHTEPLDIGIYARDDYYFGYHDERFKAIMATIDTTIDPARRTALYGEAQRKIAEDAVNAFLFQLPKIGVWRAELSGLWTNSPIQANDIAAAVWR
ncbi:MAG: ABC transporter substrate-binding protein [Alphaproteobacteria bacterium]|nr:ABC transporter substrate-binding protein [Alphaproteobacteria bacterium]